MRHLRICTAIVLFSLATAAFAQPVWPTIPGLPSGPRFTAAKTGVWSDGPTWKGGRAPTGDGAVVVIPYPYNVTLSGPTPKLRWVEVRGTLTLSSSANTTMYVDTLRIAFTGKFTADLHASPNVTANVIFTTNNSTLPPNDPQQVTRGLIGEGVVKIIGLPKANMVTVSADLPHGTQQFNVDVAPQNWSPGDSIVIAGTHFRRVAPMQDERCRINSINGTLITLVGCQKRDGTLSPNLSYDHLRVSTGNDPASQTPTVLHVANLTRNVVFSSAVTSPAYNRGHVLIGHQDSDIENVAFVNLGRTDKSKPLDDYKINTDTNNVPTSLTPRTSGISNIRGRYPLYVFNTAGNPPNNNTQDAFPHVTVIQGCVVDGSIGWGFANRRSNVRFDSNVAWNFIGAGFVAEGGDELGSFINNIAIHGTGQIVIDQPPQYQTSPTKDKEDFNHYRKQRLNFMNPTRPQPLEDIAFNGEGFWFSGPALTVTGNVANSCHGTGMIWHTTGVVEVSTITAQNPSFGIYTYFPQAWISTAYAGTNLLPLQYTPRHWSSGTGDLLAGDLPILNCANFTGYANFVGFRLRFSNFDNVAWYDEMPYNYQTQVQGTVPPSRQKQTMQGLNLWNNEAAITLTYDSFTDWSNVTGISRLDYDGSKPFPPYVDPGISPNDGVEANFFVSDMNWTGLTLDGYELATWQSDGSNTAGNFSLSQQVNRNFAQDGLWDVRTTSPVCPSPGIPVGSADTSGNGTISWPAAIPPTTTSLTRYLLRYRAIGDQQWRFATVDGAASAPSIAVSGLIPGKAYQIQVDAGCTTPNRVPPNGLSPWVTGTTFNAPCAPAGIAVPPADATVPSGQMATLSVAASGDGPLSYQWYEGAAGTMDNPVGGNSNTLSIIPAASTSYWVSVTNACGTTSSNAAMVTLCDPPAIAAQPQSQTVTAGSSAALSMTAAGNGPFTYQWYESDSMTPIGTDSTLTVTPNATTSYWVTVTNGCGTTTSDTAIVTVCVPPTIDVPPVSQTISSGSSVTLDVGANGSGPFTYQWYLGAAPSTANPIPTTDSPLTVAPTTTTSYWVSVTNDCGIAQSNTVTVSVCNPPGIVTQPASQTIPLGSAVILSVTATGVGPISYQWYRGGTPVGSNSSSLTDTPSGTIDYLVAVSNSCGTTFSSVATVTVCAPPTIVTQPASQTVGLGSSATLTVTASGGGPYSYQWYQGTSPNTAMPVGSNSSTFTTPPLTAPQSWWVRVTSTCYGTATVDSATATVSVQSQIVRRQLAGNNANSMPSVTTNWGQPTQAGSLLVAVISASNVASIGPFTPPAGWLLASTSSWSNIKTSIYYYPNNPGGRTSETFSLTYYPDSTLDLIEYTGVTTVSPLDQTASDGGNAPIGTVAVDTGMTPTTTKQREVVVTALTTYAQSSFTFPTNNFVKIDEQNVLYDLTTAVFENLVTATGSWGHQADVGGNAQWVGLVATFEAVDCSGPPAISAQPASTSIVAGQSATLSVTVAGSGLNYQWYQGAAPSTTNPIGGNSSSLTVTPAATTSYWVNVSSACGSTASTTATVSVCTLPTIITQPQSQTITAGSSATLSVTAGGNGPFTYQWYQGTSGNTTTPIGTNSNTLSVSPTATTSYWVNVTNGCGGGTASNTAVVSVCNPPAIVSQPQSQTVTAGSTVTFTVTASGTAPLTFQWYQGTSGTTTTPVGTNSSTFTVTPGATTSFWVRVTNGCGSASSNTVTVTICTPPTITAQPQSVTITAGSSATLSVTAGGNGTFTYQWYQGTSGTTTTPIGTNSSSLTVTPAATTSYWVNVTNGCGGGTASSTAVVSVCNPPAIVSQPPSPTVPAGSAATLTVTASGTTPLTYQWYQGASGTTTTPVGTNSSTLTVTPAATTSYWVRVTNACGSASSNTATVTICSLPSITAQPQSQAVTAGSSATLSVTAGNGPFTYQWYQGTSGTTTTPIGTNSSSVTVTPAATTSYWVKVSNACGAVSSSTATVTVCTPPGIATQPASQSVSSGSSATLSVTASGSGPFSYQWYQGTSGTTTTPVGSNSSSFSTPALAATTSYWVRVTSACNGGTANSATATITVLTHIARRQLASANANSMSSLTANWTQATQAGSLLVAVFTASDGNPIGAFTPPAGWQLANSYTFNNAKASIYYYPNNPGGRTAETFYLTNYPDSTLDLIEYTGVMVASPLDKTGFDGGWNPMNGVVTSGSTQTTAQSKEVVVTALTTYAQTSFTNATNSFTKIDEQQVLYHLTTAVHENIVTAAGSWGHSANAGGNAPWVGLVVTFKSADTSP